jgi:molybdopterin/thiamine biosynthesis adenylyltransferase
MLTDSDKKRYLRQIRIEGFGEKAQERLKSARVLVAGAGGLGCSASLYLAAAGIGGMRIVDQGKVELSNLNRQVAYCEGDIGAPKVEAIAKRIAGLNGGVHVEPLHLRLDEENLPSIVKGCGLIIDALDNLPTRYAVNKAAIYRGVPIIHGAAMGFFGQIMTVVPGETPCLMCLYRNKAAPGETPVIGVAPGVIGILQATEAVKLLTGLGRQMRGVLLVFDGLGMSFTEVEIPRDPECPHCGSAAVGTQS